YRIDCGKEVFYALDEEEKEGVLDRLSNKRAKINVQRFKGLGEMNPLQLRETTMDPNTRRLVQLTIDDDEQTNEMMDMLLGKNRSDDRRRWLQCNGDKADIDAPSFISKAKVDVSQVHKKIKLRHCIEGKNIMNSLDLKVKAQLEKILNLDERIDAKLNDIKSGDVSPFFLTLMGLETTLIAKISHSLSTTFGMSFYEQVSEILAKEIGYEVKLQHKILGEVSPAVNDYLQTTLDSTKYIPNRESELATIKALAGRGRALEHPDSTVDVFIKLPDDTEVYIDITTVKPNKKEFRTMKRKLLTWTAMRLSVNPDAKVQAYIAIPYNPEKGNYSRHSGYYDRKDLLVADELWELVSGGSYNIEKINHIFSLLHKDVTEKVKAKLQEALN
ncbi:TdeIII family type II restriction endonuclease, partial [Aliivibrio fischeri]|uniref:TdeIII family type II restriction endonuclease n=1 Tax=Aliivibrio fischeri TaxID=668 RepID=UPI00354D5269